MGDTTSWPSGDALEDAAFLARSDNRVRILDALCRGACSRRDLVETADVSSATAGRVLNELQSRGWAERTAEGYVVTAVGRRVADEFDPFLGAMSAINHLGDAVEWIPTDELTIGLHHFRDATVRRPERNDPAEAVEFFIELLREARRFRGLTHLVPIEAKEELMLRGLRSGRLTVEVVVTEGLVDYFRSHPDHVDRWERILAVGGEMFCHRGPIPCNLFVMDDVVILGNSHSDSGHPYAFLVSDDPAVTGWALDVVDRYRDAADPVAMSVTDVGATVHVD